MGTLFTRRPVILTYSIVAGKLLHAVITTDIKGFALLSWGCSELLNVDVTSVGIEALHINGMVKEVRSYMAKWKHACRQSATLLTVACMLPCLLCLH